MIRYYFPFIPFLYLTDIRGNYLPELQNIEIHGKMKSKENMRITKR